MPQSECITLARVNEQNAEQALRSAGCWFQNRISTRPLGTMRKRLPCTACPDRLWARLCRRRPPGLKDSWPFQLEADPAHGGAQEACAERHVPAVVLAAEIARRPAEGVSTTNSPGGAQMKSMNRAAFERKPLVIAPL